MPGAAVLGLDAAHLVLPDAVAGVRPPPISSAASDADAAEGEAGGSTRAPSEASGPSSSAAGSLRHAAAASVHKRRGEGLGSCALTQRSNS